MSAAPRLTAAQRRTLAALQAEVEQRVSAAGHEITWSGSFTTVNSAGAIVRMADGWCRRCHRLRAVIDPVTAGGEVAYRFGTPDKPCPTAS